MAKKDFWFPFLFEKFLGSTNGWSDDQAGAYLRLLIYQFQNGFIPSNMKQLCRIAPSAKKHWALLSLKFKEGNGGLYNEVMDEIRKSRMGKIESAIENGKKGGRPKISETKTETQPFSETTTQPETNINTNINTERNTGIAWEMIHVFSNRFPDYPVDKDRDLMAVMQIANKICDKLGFQKYQIIEEKRKDIVSFWAKVVDFVASDNWFRQQDISGLNKQWQRLVMAYVPVKSIKEAPSQINHREAEGLDIINEALNTRKK